MAEPTDPVNGQSEDPEWIKGLVAEALLRASGDEQPESASPGATPPPAVPTPPPIQSSAPSASVPPANGSAGTPFDTPVVPSERHVAPSTPLVVGRRGVDTPIDDAPPSLAEPIREPAAAVPGGATPAAAGITTDRLASARLQSPSMSELLGDRQDAVTVDDVADPVMVEEDATTEGFRSSDIRTVLEWLAVIVSALAVALLIKAFVLQAFWIPSESMETTVNKGDRILVNKVSYRLHDVRRGDLVVFQKLPGTPGDTDDLIKRAIALPGETIEVRSDGRIYIWGPGETADDALLLEEPYLDPQNQFLASPSASDALSIDIWDERCVNQPRTPGRCTLGPDQLFMMGDNRNSSSDSRFFGPITEDLIVGRAFLRIWPLGEISSL